MKNMEEEEFLLKEKCYQIIGACMNVHNELGCGFLEAVYQEALSYEFLDQGIYFEYEKELEIYYKDYLLSKKYQADFLCLNEIIV